VRSSNPDLIDRLCELAETTPDRVLYVELLRGTDETGRLTAGQLRDRAAAVAASLTETGVPPGGVVLEIATAPIDFLVGLFGCLWAGVIPAPIAFPRRPEHLNTRLEPVRRNAGAVAIVAGTPQGSAENNVLDLLTGAELPVVSTDAPAASPPPAPYAKRDVAYLQYTSGSTSDPKGVIVGHDNLVANLEEAAQLLGCDAQMVNVSWCPLTHDMGLILGALPSVAFGCISVLMPPGAFIRRPLVWLQAIDRYRGTHTYSPNFGYDLCVDRTTPEQRGDLELSTMRVFLNGAEPVRDRTRERFLEAFGVAGVRSDSYTPAYGLAESTVIVTATPADSAGVVLWADTAALEREEVVLTDAGDPGAHAICGDGVAGPGYDIAIVHAPTSTTVPAGRVGEVWVRGRSVCRGYWRRPVETYETFGARLVGDDGGPWLRTGDLGFMHGNELVICGRTKDLIVINGRNIHPQDLEFSAELAHPAVRVGGCAAFAVESDGGAEVAVIVAEVDGEPEAAEVASAIKSAVWRDFEVDLGDVLLVAPQHVPKTSSGKKQRSASRELWREVRSSSPLRA
jgi:acyl-CoA synthetase (AMP-forming)/AMP-acid ligase II